MVPPAERAALRRPGHQRYPKSDFQCSKRRRPLKLITRRTLASRPFQWFLYRFIRTYSWTFRLTVKNETVWKDRLAAGESVILCTWHQQFFSAIRHFEKYRIFTPSIMISQSKDGDIIAGVAQRSGWHPVRGSSSKGGKPALAQMIQELGKKKLAAHIVDGPRGPMGKVKAGIIRLAQATNSSIVPFSVNAEEAWQFNSWDRFFIPKPFSAVTLQFREAIPPDPKQGEDRFENQRLMLEKTMRPFLVV